MLQGTTVLGCAELAGPSTVVGMAELGTPTAWLACVIVVADAGAGTEASILGAIVSVLDGGTSTDLSDLSALLSPTDAGAGSGRAFFLIDDLDTASGSDKVLYLFVRYPGSPWGWKVYRVVPAPTSHDAGLPGLTESEVPASAPSKVRLPGLNKIV